MRPRSRHAQRKDLHVTAPEAETREDFYPNYSAYLKPLFQGPMLRQAYDQMLAPGGSLVGGDVQQVIDKLTMLREMTGATRYVAQIDIGESWLRSSEQFPRFDKCRSAGFEVLCAA
jgi:hypothetical protein